MTLLQIYACSEHNITKQDKEGKAKCCPKGVHCGWLEYTDDETVEED